MSWHTLHTQTTTHYTAWHYHAHMVAPIELIVNYKVKTLYLLNTAFPKPPGTPCNQPRSPALTAHRRFRARRLPKTKRTHRRRTPKTNHDQPNKKPRMSKAQTEEKTQRLVFCFPLTPGERKHPAKNTAPAASPYSAASKLSKRITVTKRLFACALATLHARSDHGSGPFLVPFWASKKGQ